MDSQFEATLLNAAECVDCSLHFEEITIDELVFHNFAVFAWQKYLLVALHKRSSLRIALESHREL